MKPESPTCDQRMIADFLSGALSDADQLSLEEHLNHCEACCEQLRHQTADRDLWEKASLYLQDDDGELNPLSGLSTSSDAAAERSSAKQVLDALAPTDDPQMLGRIDGYEISGVIGCGGMGAVLKGHDRSLNRVVAIKVMSPHLATSGAARQRFAREAQAAAAITHDNVIEIYGVSQAKDLPYLVMPYARGENLQKRVDSRGPLPVVEILRIGHQIALGLSAAHSQGLVHRDIKPANILLSDGIDRLVITDFGLARAVDDASVTRTGVIAGTPQYMSPEQARGESIDHRSDLFSLGSVMYTLCTGRIPFRAESALGMLRRITDTQPRPIREINPEMPEWLCRIIGRLHEKSPNDRYQTAEEVAELLQQCLVHVQTDNTPLPQQLQTNASRSTLTKVSWFAGGAVLMAAIMLLVSQIQSAQKTPRVNSKVASAASSTAQVDLPADGVIVDGAIVDGAIVDDPSQTLWDDNFVPPLDIVSQQARQLVEETRDLYSNQPSAHVSIQGEE